MVGGMNFRERLLNKQTNVLSSEEWTISFIFVLHFLYHLRSTIFCFQHFSTTSIFKTLHYAKYSKKYNNFIWFLAKNRSNFVFPPLETWQHIFISNSFYKLKLLKVYQIEPVKPKVNNLSQNLWFSESWIEKAWLQFCKKSLSRVLQTKLLDHRSSRKWLDSGK